MFTEGMFWIGQAQNENKDRVCIVPKMANRHGLIAGATGTGKTITLKVLAESFSDCGIPVFLADVKGDVVSISQPGEDTEDMQKRIQRFGLAEAGFHYQPYPTCIWDVLGEEGHPLRTTVTEMGPLLLAQLLELNETQSNILSILFRIADDNGLLLIDLKDLRIMLEFVGQNAKEFTLSYGNITSQSIGAIVRSISALEQQGGDKFFGEPSVDIRDWMRTDYTGKGYVNVLHCVKLIHSPKLYATFMLWLMSELFEDLPEAGDLEKPRMVFFFDEAHLLFKSASRSVLQKIEQVVKLVRSKGVGIYFVTQNPSDIPDEVLGQLGNRVQHALRAYTPADQKAVKAAAQAFRENPEFSTLDVITRLGVGEALISFLDEEGIPSIVQYCKVLPPQSRMGTIQDQERYTLLLQDGLGPKYDTLTDRESAYEVLMKKFEEQEEALRQAEEEAAREKERIAREKEEERLRREKEREEERLRREKEREEERLRREKEREEREQRRKNAVFEKTVNNALNTLGREVTKSLWRGILGNLKKK
ncbi:MAG: DUF853 family protein [Blautia sp.]|nr:DUF853 family protein [Blautia sp.]